MTGSPSARVVPMATQRWRGTRLGQEAEGARLCLSRSRILHAVLEPRWRRARRLNRRAGRRQLDRPAGDGEDDRSDRTNVASRRLRLGEARRKLLGQGILRATACPADPSPCSRGSSCTACAPSASSAVASRPPFRMDPAQVWPRRRGGRRWRPGRTNALRRELQRDWLAGHAPRHRDQHRQGAAI